MDINLPVTKIVCGKPKSGKSYYIKWFMLKYSKYYGYGIVFNKTKFTKSYDYIPDKFIHSQYNEKIVKNLMSIQSKIIEIGQKPQEAFIIFDDCLETEQFKSPLFTDLITQYRHYHISVIIATQYIYKIPPTVRECCQLAVMFRQTTERSIEALHETFGNVYSKSVNDFSKFLQDNTQNHQFIIYNSYFESDNNLDAYSVNLAPEKLPNDIQITFNVK